MYHSEVNVPVELAFQAAKSPKDIFNHVDLDVVFTDPEGKEQCVPAFWAGENEFRVRFAASRAVRYAFRSVCSRTDDPGLHGVSGRLEVTPYSGANPLYRHGRLQVALSRRTLEHQDGTPFLWLADTWWMGLCKRLEWPGDFRILTSDRVEKGFSVIQIVAGLYPDMEAFDERGANEAGFPWEKGFLRINPSYFDMADLRIHWLVSSGIVPCIVGCWGYFLSWMGREKMKKHWRYLAARYAAFPVVFCLAGEATMPFYLSSSPEEDARTQKSGWTELASYLRGIDPFRNPITIHPGTSSRDQLEDPALIDLDMLQTGHSDRACLGNTLSLVRREYQGEPTVPVINGEVCYEGIGGASADQVQRLMFWCCVLNGAAGHTYGANGIWQLNSRRAPYGPSPHGMSWGGAPWEEAYQLPGSRQLGFAKALLQRFEWWRFEPHPEWVEPQATVDAPFAPYAAGIPGEIRIIYLPLDFHGKAIVRKIEPEASYRAWLFDPVTAEEHDLGDVKAGGDGSWKPIGDGKLDHIPVYRDWVVVLEVKDPGSRKGS